MNKAQTKHLARIKAKLIAELEIKYRKGAKEHGDNLLGLRSRELFEEIKQEAIDLYCYAETGLERCIKED